MFDFDKTPINRTLGIRLVQSGSDGGEVSLEDCSAYTQEGGVVHGGILTTLADTAAVYAILPDLPTGKRMTSIEFKMNFFRPGLANGGPLIGRSNFIKRGRKVNVCEAEVLQDDRLLAKGTFTYLVFDAED
ncbi:MAG: PaaI family thioesterase [Planctomycetota bacterium]